MPPWCVCVCPRNISFPIWFWLLILFGEARWRHITNEYRSREQKKKEKRDVIIEFKIKFIIAFSDEPNWNPCRIRRRRKKNCCERQQSMATNANFVWKIIWFATYPQIRPIMHWANCISSMKVRWFPAYIWSQPFLRMIFMEYLWMIRMRIIWIL